LLTEVSHVVERGAPLEMTGETKSSGIIGPVAAAVHQGCRALDPPPPHIIIIIIIIIIHVPLFLKILYSFFSYTIHTNSLK
jgi:hypothetical protein